jgi:hypothetical protein
MFAKVAYYFANAKNTCLLDLMVANKGKIV